MSRRSYSGFNEETNQNLLLDAGAIFVNFDIEEDTYDSAVESGKLLGATSGGNTFAAVPEFRDVAVDGVKGKAKGLSILTSWEVTMTTNMLEFKEETYRRALAAAQVEDKTIGDGDYSSIRAKNHVSDEDYIDNITFIGQLSGSSKPVYIQVYNALNLGGLTVNNADDTDIVAELVFTGHYDANDLDNPPFTIFYPKKNEEEVEDETVE